MIVNKKVLPKHDFFRQPSLDVPLFCGQLINRSESMNAEEVIRTLKQIEAMYAEQKKQNSDIGEIDFSLVVTCPKFSNARLKLFNKRHKKAGFVNRPYF